jgi:hypothetical protein
MSDRERLLMLGARGGSMEVVRGDQVRLLVTVEPAGAEYFFVPRDDGDADPARFGIVLHEPAQAA